MLVLVLVKTQNNTPSDFTNPNFLSCFWQGNKTSFPGDHSEREPPDPFPNSEVKLLSANGSVGPPHARVGHRQDSMQKSHPLRGWLFFRIESCLTLNCFILSRAALAHPWASRHKHFPVQNIARIQFKGPAQEAGPFHFILSLNLIIRRTTANCVLGFGFLRRPTSSIPGGFFIWPPALFLRLCFPAGAFSFIATLFLRPLTRTGFFISPPHSNGVYTPLG